MQEVVGRMPGMAQVGMGQQFAKVEGVTAAEREANLKRFLEGSAVKDVVYHGTRAPYLTRFDEAMQGKGIVGGGKGGFFFTSTRENAEFFADYRELPDLSKFTEDDVQVYGEDGKY